MSESLRWNVEDLVEMAVTGQGNPPTTRPNG